MSGEIIRGKAWKFGHNIDTDIIIPARYLSTSDPDQLAAHCMEGEFPGFNKSISPGDIILAGENFGCGSSREHAPVCIQAAGISCVSGCDFFFIFFVFVAIIIGNHIVIFFPALFQGFCSGDKGFFKFVEAVG